MSLTRCSFYAGILGLFFFVLSCSDQKPSSTSAKADTLKIDGSSTVYPITTAIAGLYQQKTSDLKIFVGVSGTGGGFTKFARKETGINNASRPITEAEKNLCEANGVEFVQLEVAYDGIAVVVNTANDWVDYLTLGELKKIWTEGGALKWSDVRPGWPAEKIELLAPGEASGTYDYFNEVVVGSEGSFRKDYKKSENDNLLALGMSGSPYSLGFFGLAYYEKNKDKLKLVAIDNGSGPVVPSGETVASGQYSPLSRSLFIYANTAFAESPKGKEFLKFYLENAAVVAGQVGYIPLPVEKYTSALAAGF